jgi:hypothetical protein
MSSLQVNRINDASGGVLAPISSVMRNRIINGQMTIDQRNAGASVTPITNQYTLDRWNSYQTPTGKYSVQQNAGSVTPPVGFTNYLGVTSLSAYSVAAGNLFTIMQYIEGFNVADLGWGTANAKTVTLSFWVRSSLTGTFGGSITNSAQDRSYPFSYTINSANTWEYETITIAGDTSGTWLKTNGNGLSLFFGIGVGSTYSGTAGAWSGSALFAPTGATSVVGTNGATFYITGVQLEVGTQATSFEYRQYQQELALCQRYYNMQARAAGDVGVAWYYTNSQCSCAFSAPVTMRVAPSVSFASGAYYTLYRNGGANTINGWIIDNPSTNFVTIYNFAQASGTAGQCGLLRITDSQGFIAASAEL